MDVEELEAQGTNPVGSSAGRVTQLIPVQDWEQGGAGCLQGSGERAGNTPTAQQAQPGSRQQDAETGTENYIQGTVWFKEFISDKKIPHQKVYKKSKRQRVVITKVFIDRKDSSEQPQHRAQGTLALVVHGQGLSQ